MHRVKHGWHIGILTVSDSCFKKECDDRSGANLVNMIQSRKFSFSSNVEEIKTFIVPDEIRDIQVILKMWADEDKLDLILTVGGTGFSLRDVTPEATKSIIDREAQSLATAMVLGCQKKTSFSVLSRSICGIRGKTLILNLPGSMKGSQECLEQVSDVIMHAVDQLQGKFFEVAKVHQKIQGSSCCRNLPKKCQ